MTSGRYALEPYDVRNDDRASLSELTIPLWRRWCGASGRSVSEWEQLALCLKVIGAQIEVIAPGIEVIALTGGLQSPGAFTDLLVVSDQKMTADVAESGLAASDEPEAANAACALVRSLRWKSMAPAHCLGGSQG